MKPFEYGCVVKGDTFCPRPEIESLLTSNMESGQNTVVVGERRMGKTSLIMSAFSKTRRCRLLYVDLLNIRTISDFCDRVASAASRMGTGRTFLQKTLSFLARLRPTLSVDPHNGMPVVSVDSHLAEHVSSFEDIIAMIEKFAEKDRVVVVFDEFQEILKLDNPEQALASLRSRIQFLSDTCFVYSGSVRRDMVRMFIDYKSPFYKSAMTLNVGAIDDASFIKFLQRRFSVSGKSQHVGDDAFLFKRFKLFPEFFAHSFFCGQSGSGFTFFVQSAFTIDTVKRAPFAVGRQQVDAQADAEPSAVDGTEYGRIVQYHSCPASSSTTMRSIMASSSSGLYSFLSEAPKVQAKTW